MAALSAPASAWAPTQRPAGPRRLPARPERLPRRLVADGDRRHPDPARPHHGPHRRPFLVGSGDHGLQAYLDSEINAGGGVAGRRIELVVKDDGFVPTATAEEVGELLAADKPFAVTTLGFPHQPRRVRHAQRGLRAASPS
ncbi:MAG: ABC transporter substrate-binding protein [Acidimicrobiales bacterium]